MKVNGKQIGKVIMGTGKVLICTLSSLALIAPHVESGVNTVKRLVVKPNYNGAIKTIVNSDMLGSYKKEAVDAVLKDKDSEYYKSVMSVVNSNVMGSYKVELIKKISE